MRDMEFDKQENSPLYATPVPKALIFVNPTAAILHISVEIHSIQERDWRGETATSISNICQPDQFGGRVNYIIDH